MDKIVLPQLQEVTRLRDLKEHNQAWNAISSISTTWKITDPAGVLRIPLSQFTPEEIPLLIKFCEEITICAYYVGNIRIGMLACDILFQIKGSFNKQMVGNNLQFYVDAMPSNSIIDLSNQFVTFPKYNRSNPSVINWEDELIINCRLVNYTQEGATNFKSNDADGKIRTRNLLRRCRFNSVGTDLETVGPVTELVDENNGYKTCESSVLGLEDIRLFKVEDDCWALGTSQCAGIDTKVSIVLCYLGTSIIFKRSTKTQPITVSALKVSNQNYCEKNWNILIDQNKVYIVYQICPTIVYLLADLSQPTHHLNFAKQNFGSRPITLKDPIIVDHPHIDIKDTRGGSNYIPYNLNNTDGFLCIAHHVVFRNNRRYYYHRWVFLTNGYSNNLCQDSPSLCVANPDISYWNSSKHDIGYGISACSGLFYLMGQGIEFALSLSKHPTLPIYYVGCGIEDREAMLLSYQKSEIDKQLIFD